MTTDLEDVLCVDCGILFGISKDIHKVWVKSEKRFYCPNGHTLFWPKGTETVEQKELKELRIKVKDLETKLEEVRKSLSTEQQKNAELITELEIWKPSAKES